MHLDDTPKDGISGTVNHQPPPWLPRWEEGFTPPPLRYCHRGGSDWDGIRTFFLFTAIVAALTGLMVWGPELLK